MLTSSDMCKPILSRSAGCPLTSKVALVTMPLPHVFWLFCFAFCFYEIHLLTCLLSYRFIFIHVSTMMPVLSVTGWPLPHRKTHVCPLSEGYFNWSRIGHADWSIGGIMPKKIFVVIFTNKNRYIWIYCTSHANIIIIIV